MIAQEAWLAGALFGVVLGLTVGLAISDFKARRDLRRIREYLEGKR